ncbi:MAG: PHP domain-containing protein [Candidatus Nezhaarchaeota archaeon]|nr:PHP domain-containing protein [Candidatus Nezhaarchaeota archaeon]MCX8141385.1 PHP domain-containing protein [Candidatus Nezhaarchaeota archaeon]MDW8049651.1 PHP domain-containing protein [Nitrososphaerota archaeon]
MIIADLHVHSHNSIDSFLDPQRIIEVALKRGLNCVAVTDHNTVRGGLELVREAKSYQGFIAIPGVELKTNIGDVILLFIEEEVKIKSYNEVLDYAESMDALTVLAHPYRGHVMIDDVAKKVHAIEVLNSRSDKIANSKAYNLALKLGKPMIAGSDAHMAFEIGKAVTIVNGSTIEDVRKAIIKGSAQIAGSESNLMVHAFSLAAKLAKIIMGKHKWDW